MSQGVTVVRLCGVVKFFFLLWLIFLFQAIYLDSIQDSKFEGCNLDKINSVMYPYLWGQ